MTAETALPPRPGRPGDPGPPGLALRPGSGRSCLDVRGTGLHRLRDRRRGGPARPTPRCPADEGVSVTARCSCWRVRLGLCAGADRLGGSILFFSFGVAPIIFPVLGAEAGGKFVRALSRGIMPGARSRGDRAAVVRGGPLCFPEYRGPMVAVAGADDPGGHPDHALRGQHADPGHQRRARRRPVGATAVRPAASPRGPAQRRGPGAGGGPADRLRHPPRAPDLGDHRARPRRGVAGRFEAGADGAAAASGRAARPVDARRAGIVAGPLSGGPGPEETGVRRVTCRKLVKSRGLGRPIP